MSIPDRVAEHIAGAPLSAHLATSVDDRPHVAPVWYVYDDGSLWVATGGKKLENVRRNPRVAVSIESADRTGNVDWNATLLATARVVEDAERESWVLDRLGETYRGGDGAEGGHEGEGGDDVDGDEDSGHDGSAGDGGDLGSDGGEEPEGALMELRVASASLSTY